MTTKISHTTSILAVNDMHGGVTDNPAVKSAKLRFGIIGNAPALAEAVARAIRVAPIDLSVLVTGESGSGKEFFRKSSTKTRRASMPSTLPSIAAPFPKAQLIPSFSATKRRLHRSRGLA